MLSEIKVYELTVIKKMPFLKFFKRKFKIVYRLTYKIDEDRFWYYKIEGKKQTDDHLMKQNLSNSILTMEKIKERYERFNDILKEKCEIQFFNIKDCNKQIYDTLSEYSDNKEETYIKKNNNNNKTTSQFNCLLSNDIM